MRQNSPRADWFFPIKEAPVLVTVTLKGVARDVRVPHKKALIAADTGDIVGIVGAGYKVLTNQQAVTLCHKFCLEAFPDTTPAEWTFVEGHGPGTRSWAAMDTLEIAMLGAKGFSVNDPSEKYQLRSLPGDFTGLHLLCIEYVGFKIIDPSVDIGFDIAVEYEKARQIHKEQG